LHWALRKVLGEHVKQAGSWVGPDRLRFDFSHYASVTPEEIEEIERLANGETLANAPVRAFETTKDEAETLGAIAFFGDKYGDIVRVLEAGSSVELCGGTHVRATGDIGTIKIVSEASIGSNLRRIEALTGANSVALFQELEREIVDVADVLGATPSTVKDSAEKRIAQIKALEDENRVLRAQLAVGRAGELAAACAGWCGRGPGRRSLAVRPARPGGRGTPAAGCPTGRSRRHHDDRRRVARGGGPALRGRGGGRLDPRRGQGGRRGRRRQGRHRDGRRQGPGTARRRTAPRTRGSERLNRDMRALGVDLGSKRIGIAVSDSSGTIASPLTVVHRSRSRRVDLDEIARIARDEEVELIVVGLPLTMRGEVGHAAEAAIAEAGRLATVVGVPVETHDERLTTVTADRSMIEAGMRGEARRQVVDKVAAAVMLQSWLDARRARSTP
jgi:putative transcription antitermination factor YqgF